MKKAKKIGLVRGSITGIVIAGCVGAITAHMYFVYMSGQYVNMARQIEEEIYFARNKIVQIASTSVEGVDMHSVVASHLVIAEPVTVSSGHTHE